MTRSYDYAPCPAGCGYVMDWVAGVPTCRKCGATLPVTADALPPDAVVCGTCGRDLPRNWLLCREHYTQRIAELEAEITDLHADIAGWMHATCCETWQEADVYVDQLVDDIDALNPPAKENE